MRGIWLTLALVLTSTSALAKSHFLPDYQGAGLEYRAQETDKKISINTCSTYGLYNSIQSNMTCHVVYPTSGLTCYNCACDSAYKYSSADCPTSSYSLSEQCGGKYKSCSCDTSLYPTTSATSGCSYGLVPDPDNYCEDKPDGTKHYACVRPVCKPDNIMVEECQAKGDGYNCTASKEANCTDYCDSNGCQDNCTYLKQTGQARSDCQYGCATGKDVSDCANLCYECGEAPESPTNTCLDTHYGSVNTKAIVSQLGADALAATAASQYYAVNKNGTFGQGKWYLPSIGELVDMYGVDPDQITSGSGKTGATGGYMEKINYTLNDLVNKGVDAQIMQDTYLSSSENSADSVWTFTVSSANGSGNRSTYSKDFDYKIRPFLKTDDISSGRAPKIGQVYYEDKTFGNVRDYHSWSSKKPVGVIVSVIDNGSYSYAKVINLKDLTFSSIDSSGNFDADNPYSGKNDGSAWATAEQIYTNVPSVPNYSSDQLKTMLKKCATKEEITCPVDSAVLSAIFDGKSNTQKILAQLGKSALAAYDVSLFYVGNKNGDFGQGNWYLPAIGELIDMYGADTSQFIMGSPETGALGDNKARVDAALTTLKGKGVEAENIARESYWSSTEYAGSSTYYACELYMGKGSRSFGDKLMSGAVRPFLLLTLSAGGNNGANAPKTGDVVYEDKTFGSADNYDGSKTPVGIIVAVSTASGSVKIISLKDLTFSSYGDYGNFNSDNPYGGSIKTTYWAQRYMRGNKSLDIEDIPNVDDGQIRSSFNECPVYEW